MAFKTKFKGYYADCYVLSDKRHLDFILSFLDKFLPNHIESADEYKVPQYSDSSSVSFNNADDLIEYLSENINETYSIYWANKETSVLKGAMCFFTNDGNIIIGVYCDTAYPDTTIEKQYLAELKDFCKSQHGYITYEETAPDNTPDFLEKVQRFEALKNNIE